MDNTKKQMDQQLRVCNGLYSVVYHHVSHAGKPVQMQLSMEYLFKGLGFLKCLLILIIKNT